MLRAEVEARMRTHEVDSIAIQETKVEQTRTSYTWYLAGTEGAVGPAFRAGVAVVVAK